MNILAQQESLIFKMLSEEIRLRIAVLLTEGELCVCDIMEVLSLPQSSVSRPMAKLKSSQLVIDRRDGRWVHYRLNESINDIIPSLSEILVQFRTRQPYQADNKRLTEYLLTKNCQ